jgi:hypothetical protein
MFFRRASRRRADVRAFRPVLEGRRLETRLVLTQTNPVVGHYLLTHPQIGAARRLNNPPFLSNNAPPIINLRNYNHGIADVQTAHGGQAVNIMTPDGGKFRVGLVLADNQYDGGLQAETGSTGTNVVPSTVVQPNGTVRAYAMPGGKVGLILDGTTQNMALEIDPLPFPQRKGYAHSFAYNEGNRTHVLNIGSLNVSSGQLSEVLGFHSADLSGPLIIGGTGTVDRLAFNSLQNGASIAVGGTVNTLDVANNVDLETGSGITIAQDLNLFNVGGNATFTNGASLNIGRFAGATPQPPKGTSTGSNILSVNQALIGTGTSTTVPSVSANIQGDFTVGTGSVFHIGSGIFNSSFFNGQATPAVFLISGKLNGVSASQFQIPNLTTTVGGTVVPQVGNTIQYTIGGFLINNKIVARNGSTVPGLPFANISA